MPLPGDRLPYTLEYVMPAVVGVGVDAPPPPP